MSSKKQELTKTENEIQNMVQVAEKYRTLKQRYELKVHELALIKDRLKHTTHYQQKEEIDTLKQSVAELTEKIKTLSVDEKNNKTKVQEIEKRIKNSKHDREKRIKDAESEMKSLKKQAETSKNHWKKKEQVKKIISNFIFISRIRKNLYFYRITKQ